jgi:hypothetical protein
MGDDEHLEHARKGSGKGKAKKGGAVFSEEDRESFFVLLLLACLLNVFLYREYRYRSFMEAHPTHNSLPTKAKLEVMDVLTWDWTGKMAFFYSLRAPVCSKFHFFSSTERLLPFIVLFLLLSLRKNAMNL